MAYHSKLDTQFSLYVRLKNTDANGYGKCCTCGKTVHYKESDCGHFQSRKHLRTRWEEKNTGIQCLYCNRFNQGQQYAFSIYLDKKYGPGTAISMVIESKRVWKIGKFEIDVLTKYYREQIKILEGGKVWTTLKQQKEVSKNP